MITSCYVNIVARTPEDLKNIRNSIDVRVAIPNHLSPSPQNHQGTENALLNKWEELTQDPLTALFPAWNHGLEWLVYLQKYTMTLINPYCCSILQPQIHTFQLR